MQSTTVGTRTRESWLTVHPLTSGDRSVMAAIRAQVEPNKGRLRGVAARATFDAIISHTIAPEGVVFREDRLDTIPGWWCEPAGASPGVAVLHLHGGWFNWGSSAAYRNLVGHIARGACAATFIPEYRLAPEHPFPAAIEDGRTILRALGERGIRRIALTGDSAGGNLAVSLSLSTAASASGVSIVGTAAFSPVTDLALTGSSWQSRAEADPFFVREQVEGLVQAYLNGHDPKDPMASPLYGSFTGSPPLRVQVGNDEVLLADSERLIERAVAAGVDARLDVWEGMPHGFMGSIGQMESADSALRLAGEFLASRLA